MYHEHYGLTGRPFQLTPDPHYYFESTTHRKALSYLGYGLAQGEGFIVITGEVGSGKTMLVRHLMATIDPGRLTAAQVVTTQLSHTDMVGMAASAFGVPTVGMDKAAALGRIEAFLHAEARAGRRCLLIVDEAQSLSVDALEELRMLSNFQLGGHALLQIFLLGQPEFRERIARGGIEQLRQRVIATHHLEAMEPGEVAPYVMHRLEQAGWTGHPAFAPDAFDVLARETGALPRRINIVMNRVMLAAAMDNLDRINGGLIAAVASEMSDEAPHAVPQDDAAPATGATTAMAPVAAAVDRRVLDAAMDRIAQLEAQAAEQEATLRRVLRLMIDWVENDGPGAAPAAQRAA